MEARIPDHVFLSPHFDDAIGSCGGLIARLLGVGQQVRMITVFGGSEREPFSMPARVLHEEWGLQRPVARRRSEDAAACRVLGCEGLFLEFPDAIYRQDSRGAHLYPSFECLRGPIAQDDLPLIKQIAGILQKDYPQSWPFFYCPMAIGSHVDHTIVKNCGLSLCEFGHAVAYYRDFHYDKSWDGRIEDATLTEVRFALTEQEIGLKVRAFSHYGSQISDLFRDTPGMISYFSTIGGNESLFLTQSMIHRFSVPLQALSAPAEGG